MGYLTRIALAGAAACLWLHDVAVLPVLGKGPVQNVIDVLYLKSIDMGLVATDVP
jgi:hypothetical protein